MNPNLAKYIETALFSSNDDGGDPLDKNYSIEDFNEAELEKAQADLTSFFKQAGDLIDGIDQKNVAHDFWLTRNNHGAGFWDGDYEKKLGQKLTNLSKTFSPVDIYVGDDQKLYFFP